MIKYSVESMSHDFVAYNEIRPDVTATDANPLRALALLILLEDSL